MAQPVDAMDAIPSLAPVALPGLARGVRLLGRYEGSGFRDERFLVIRADGQIVHLSRLLYLVAASLDGRRDDRAVSERVSAQVRRRLPEEGVRFLVAQRLTPLGLLAGARVAAPPRADPLLALRLRGTLLTARYVRPLAGLLAPLLWGPLVLVVVVALGVLDMTVLWGDQLMLAMVDIAMLPSKILSVLGLVFLATFVHELGHAAACRYGGASPGRIGVGIYLIFPAFYTDVTDAYRLDRRGRLRTDLGGIYFNALTAVILLLAAQQTGSSVLLFAAFVVQLEAIQQLLPVVRFDGYYVLSDIVGVPDLFGRVRPTLASFVPGRPVDPRVAELRPRVRAIVAAWVVIVVPLLAAATVMLLVRMPAMLTSAARTVRSFASTTAAAFEQGDIPSAVLAAISIVFVVLPFVGIALMFTSLLRRVPPLVRHVRARRTPATDSPVELRPAAPAEVSVTSPAMQRPEQSDAPLAALPAPVASTTQLTAASFTDDWMLRHKARAPETGWRRGLYKATGGTVNLGPSHAEDEARALANRVQHPIRGCRRVAVLSRKGGSGKTTTTLMLGHSFAQLRGDRVVALDANPDAGSLAHRVRRETSETVTSLLGDRDLIDRYSDIRAYTSQAGTRLEVIASDDDPRITQALGERDYQQAIDLLDRHYNLILLDTGTGILDSAIQGVLEEADQIVVVMPPALDGARAAASTLDWLEQHGYGAMAAGAVAVINSVRGGGLVELDRIEDHFVNRCAGVVRIPWDPALAAGARTSIEDLRPATRKAYLTLAATVADGFDDPGARR